MPKEGAVAEVIDMSRGMLGRNTSTPLSAIRRSLLAQALVVQLFDRDPSLQLDCRICELV